MAPGRAHGAKMAKKKSSIFSVSTTVKDKERSTKSSNIKKAKDKLIPKKKVIVSFYYFNSKNLK